MADMAATLDASIPPPPVWTLPPTGPGAIAGTLPESMTEHFTWREDHRHDSGGGRLNDTAQYRFARGNIHRHIPNPNDFDRSGGRILTRDVDFSEDSAGGSP
jgi:hypothetical protein